MDNNGLNLTSEAPAHPRRSNGQAAIIHPFQLECPRCSTLVTLTAVQGDRCSGCNFELTLFEPDQDIIVQEFFEVLTGDKYIRDLPGGCIVVVHG